MDHLVVFIQNRGKETVSLGANETNSISLPPGTQFSYCKSCNNGKVFSFKESPTIEYLEINLPVCPETEGPITEETEVDLEGCTIREKEYYQLGFKHGRESK